MTNMDFREELSNRNLPYSEGYSKSVNKNGDSFFTLYLVSYDKNMVQNTILQHLIYMSKTSGHLYVRTWPCIHKNTLTGAYHCYCRVYADDCDRDILPIKKEGTPYNRNHVLVSKNVELEKQTPWYMRRLVRKVFDDITSREPDFNVGPEDDPYMNRWWIIPRNRVFNIYAHRFHHSDDDRALHDHPWWSLSYMIQGEMIEVYQDRKLGRNVHRWLFAGKWVFRSGKFAHRLVLPTGNSSVVSPVTIFITGPRFRMWGFHCPKGWVPFWKFIDNGEHKGGCGEFE